jgi:hypothetical protein
MNPLTVVFQDGSRPDQMFETPHTPAVGDYVYLPRLAGTWLVEKRMFQFISRTQGNCVIYVRAV